MDSRITKTNQALMQAYLDEKRTMDCSKIRVTELCRKANINKTTFYKHYRDVYDLAGAVEEETIRQLMSQCQKKDRIFTDPQEALSEMIEIFSSNAELLHTVFDTRESLLLSKIEDHLVHEYLTGYHSRREALLIRFCIGGAANIFLGQISEEDIAETEDILIDLLKKLSPGSL